MRLTASKTTVAVIIPHPDDEAYSMAGTLTIAKALGATIHLLCATRGEAGSHRGNPEITPDELGAIRVAELEESAAVLGVDSVEFLDWPDGGLKTLPPATSIAALGGWLEALNPNYVFSLGQDGVYGHHDHTLLHEWISEALSSLEFTGRWLSTQFPAGHFKKLWKNLKRLTPSPIDPNIHPEDLGHQRNTISLTVSIGEVRDRKLDSLRSHASQLNEGDPYSFLIRGLVEPLLGEEWFLLERGAPYSNSRASLLEPPPPKQLLHLTRDYPPLSKGGTSTVVAGLCNALQEHGYTNTVVSFDNWRPKSNARETHPTRVEHTPKGVAIHRIHSPQQWELFFERMRGEDWDYIHCHSAMLWDFTQMLCQRHTGSTSVYSVHVLQQKMNQLRGLTEPTMSSALEEKALHQADWIHAPSHSVRTYLTTTIKAPSKRIRTLPFGIELPDNLATIKLPKRPRLLYAGRFDNLKGIQEFIASLPSLLEKYPELEVVIAGGLPGNSKGERRWRKRIDSWLPENIKPRIQFTGWLCLEDLQREMSCATLLVVPSYFETFGLTALEGMLSGLAVIASDVGGLRESIVDGETGILIEPQNPSALLDAIDTILSKPELGLRLGQAGQQNVLNRWNWDNRIVPWLSLYAPNPDKAALFSL